MNQHNFMAFSESSYVLDHNGIVFIRVLRLTSAKMPFVSPKSCFAPPLKFLANYLSKTKDHYFSLKATHAQVS